MSTRVIAETKIEGKKLTIKGLPVLTNPVFKEEYHKIGTFFCKATPIDLELQIGDTIKIANQLRTWKLDAIKVNKYGKSVAYFNKYNDKNERIDTFYMVDGVKYLFAMTSGAARNGVVHRYREPKTKLEELFAQNHWGLGNIAVVDKIENAEAAYGGRWCHHMVHDSDKYWHGYRTDGNLTETYEGSWVEKSNNQYHVGCMDGAKEYKVNGGTYLVTMVATWGAKHCNVVMTKEANENVVIEEVKYLLEKII